MSFLDGGLADGLHHRGRDLCLPLLPRPLLHGVPGVPEHQREEDVAARHVQGPPAALRGRPARAPPGSHSGRNTNHVDPSIVVVW